MYEGHLPEEKCRKCYMFSIKLHAQQAITPHSSMCTIDFMTTRYIDGRRHCFLADRLSMHLSVCLHPTVTV